jgi:hypothetical protein
LTQQVRAIIPNGREQRTCREADNILCDFLHNTADRGSVNPSSEAAEIGAKAAGRKRAAIGTLAIRNP